MSIAITNPATGQQLKTFPALTDDVLQDRILEADRAFQEYRQTSWAQRSAWLYAFFTNKQPHGIWSNHQRHCLRICFQRLDRLHPSGITQL
jgi:Aldehyde dehydrogenase family